MLAALLCLAPAAHALDEFGPRPTWRAPRAADVREQVIAWLDHEKIEADARAKILALWPEGEEAADAGVLLDRLAESFALADPEVKKLVELCGGPRRQWILPDFPRLTDPSRPEFERANLRLYSGRWLAQVRLYDEALAMLDGLEPLQVVDPAGLLFYQTILNQRLLNIEAGRQYALRLLEREDELPDRYQYLARLIREDLQGLEKDSLDHISRRMGDVQRRLELGRAGKKVRIEEDGVIAALDKLIEKLEKQRQQQQQLASSSGGRQSNRPAEESRIMGGKGPGKVEKKDIGSGSGWGDLPPKQREEALQQIGQEFPSHYRDAIEQYFRQIAGEEAVGNDE
jgi:hypothetical protein